MTIHPADPTSVTLLIHEGMPLPSVRRLVVLVPNVDIDEAELARRIWSLASPRELEVLYLALVLDPDDESRVRRQLATLAAITRDGWTAVETQPQVGRDWLQVVRRVWRPGDLIVCQAQQSVSGRGLKRQPLSSALASTLNTPVYILFGFRPAAPPRRNGRATRFIYWPISLAIIAGFFWIQVQIDQTTQGWVRTALLCLSVVAEFGLIGVWNHFLIE